MKTSDSVHFKLLAWVKTCLLSATIITLSLNNNLFAQKRIVLQHNGQASVYFVFDSLAAHLQAGDTVYFPGASYGIGTWSIDKRITIFGAGHYPDSTLATGTTYLDGHIRLKTGADNTFIQGLYLTGTIYLGSDASNQVVNNFTLSRCNIDELLLSYIGAGVTTSNNIVIRENVIRSGCYGGFATGVLMANNFLHQNVRYYSNTLFKNNIIVGNYCSGGPLYSINNSSFQNNVFVIGYYNCGGNYFLDGSTNDFQNNAFNIEVNFPYGINTGSGNWNNINPVAFFVNYNSNTFSYTQDFHLQAPATYVGTDATQIGLYGSASPYKEGAVPINPHIQAKTIAPATNTSGELNINIKVAAQNY
jgi:hypothetical protein